MEDLPPDPSPHVHLMDGFIVDLGGVDRVLYYDRDNMAPDEKPDS